MTVDRREFIQSLLAGVAGFVTTTNPDATPIVNDGELQLDTDAGRGQLFIEGTEAGVLFNGMTLTIKEPIDQRANVQVTAEFFSVAAPLPVMQAFVQRCSNLQDCHTRKLIVGIAPKGADRILLRLGAPTIAFVGSMAKTVDAKNAKAAAQAGKMALGQNMTILASGTPELMDELPGHQFEVCRNPEKYERFKIRYPF